MHNTRNRSAIFTGFSLGSLLTGAIGMLMGKPHDIVAVPPSASIDTDPFHGRHHYSGTPYSATAEDKAKRFAKLKASCRPPARRHYRPLGAAVRKPLDKPKRMKDRRAWREAKGLNEAATTSPFF